jgi:hypothetical protein
LLSDFVLPLLFFFSNFFLVARGYDNYLILGRNNNAEKPQKQLKPILYQFSWQPDTPCLIRSIAFSFFRSKKKVHTTLKFWKQLLQRRKKILEKVCITSA